MIVRHYFLAQNIEIENLSSGGFLIQIDGESKEIHSNTINITIKKRALNVMVP